MTRNEEVIRSLHRRKNGGVTDPVKLFQNVKEWRELVLDIIYSDMERRGQAVGIFLYISQYLGSLDGASTTADSKGFFQTLPSSKRIQVCVAFEQILSECLNVPSEENQNILDRLLLLIDLLNGGLKGPSLVRVVRKTQLQGTVRIRAGNLLVHASYPNGVGLAFWRGISLGADPTMMIPVTAALLEEDLVREGFEAINRTVNPLPADVSPFLLREAFSSLLERVLVSTNGHRVAVEYFIYLPLWAVEIMRDAVECQIGLLSSRRRVMLKALER